MKQNAAESTHLCTRPLPVDGHTIHSLAVPPGKNIALGTWKIIWGWVTTYCYYIYIYMVGGFNPHEKYKSQLGNIYSQYMENKKCSKPPTRYIYIYT